MNLTVLLLLLCSVLAALRAAKAQDPLMTTIRINAGSTTPFVDSHQNTWLADQYFGNTGAAFVNGNVDMPDAAIYGSERYFNIWAHPAPYRYEIPVTHQGEYAVILHFAEIYFDDVEKRVFDVWVEGSLVIDNLDIFGNVGFEKAFTATVFVMSTDGFVTVELVPEIEYPKISGIEVIDIRNYIAPTMAPSYSKAPTLTPTVSAAPSISAAPSKVYVFENIYINCGGKKYTGNTGEHVWIADKYFKGGGVYASGGDVQGTLDDALYITGMVYFRPWYIC